MRIKEKIVQTGAKYETKRTDVYLNGRLIGSTETPGIVIEELKKMRLEGIISPEVSISYNKEYAQIDIWSDEGRIVRPLIRVENGNPLLTDEHIAKLKNKELSWDNLVSRGIIEYLDAAEEENAYVALKEG